MLSGKFYVEFLQGHVRQQEAQMFPRITEAMFDIGRSCASLSTMACLTASQMSIAVFGSRFYGICLPSSDVDLVVCLSMPSADDLPPNDFLKQFQEVLQRNGVWRIEDQIEYKTTLRFLFPCSSCVGGVKADLTA